MTTDSNFPAIGTRIEITAPWFKHKATVATYRTGYPRAFHASEADTLVAISDAGGYIELSQITDAEWVALPATDEPTTSYGRTVRAMVKANSR